MTRGVKIIGICLLAGLSFAAGMLANRERPPKVAALEKRETLYSCPMHPFILRHKPGSCPICGMALVAHPPGGTSASTPRRSGEVLTSPAQRIMANLATAEVEPKRLLRELRVAGTVTFQQRRQAKVAAWVAGRLDRLHVGAVGDRITAGEVAAEIFSPELAYAEEEYLLAWQAQKQFVNSPQVSFTQGSEALMFAARDRLRLLGFKEPQFARLEREGRASVPIPIYSPLGGIVVEKLAVEGEYVNAGAPLFAIADLSTVWVEAAVYESEFPFVQLGQRAEIVSQSYPGRTFAGRVSFIHPLLDPKTRTVKVRVELPNPELMLKPDMFVTATLTAPLDPVLAVPVSAVIDTGKRRVVWVETGPGVFTAREVTVGARAGGYVQVLAGLRQGERVAVSGGYLLDSEAQFSGGSGQDPGSRKNEPQR